MTFWAELKRRNVVKVGAAYAIVAWPLIQIASVLLPTFQAQDSVMRVFSFVVTAGFPVALVIAWAFEITPKGIKPTSHVAKDDSIAPVTGQRLDYVVVGLLVVAAGWLLYRDAGGERECAAVAEAAASGVAALNERSGKLPNSIAVLLCDNFSTAPNNAFFAVSLHEEMLDQLVKLRNLNVISRTSVLQYSATERPSVIQIADELNVQSAMECGVAYGDGRIVISARLIDGATGLHLWSERYNREFADVFGIQSDIAMNVANALAVEFSLEEQRAIERVPTDSPEAYASYLQALNISGVNRGEAIRNLARALTIDPTRSVASDIPGQLDAYQWYWTNALTTFRAGSDSRAQSAVDFRQNRLDEARRVQRGAIEILPSIPVVHSWLAYIELQLGNTSAALTELRLAEQLLGDGRDIVSMPELAYTMRARVSATTRDVFSTKS